MMKKITLLFFLMIFAISGIIAQVAPVTKAEKKVVLGPLPTSVSVDVTVDQLVAIANFNLALLYDPAIMQFSSVTNLNPAFNPATFTYNEPFSGQIRTQWIAATLPEIVLNLPDGSVLFTLNFTGYNGGTSMLTWLKTDGFNVLCEYGGPLGDPVTGVLPDNPLSDYYKYGYVTNITTTLTSGVTVCNYPNYGWINITASGGSGNFIYKIDDGVPVTNTTGVFTPLPSGSYAVSIIDAAYPAVELLLDPALILNVPLVNGYLYNPRLATYYCFLPDAILAAADGDEIQFVYPQTYTGFSYNDPLKSLYFTDQIGGQTTFKGASPAVTLNSGTIGFDGVNFIVTSNDPTIQINGGKLILRNSTITESASYDQTGIHISAGELDAGITGDPGRNVFVTNLPGKAIINAGTTQASALCNYYGSVYLFDVSSKIVGDVVFDPWNDATLNNCIYSQVGAPITYAGKVFAPASPPDVIVPISVEGFNNIDAISLALQFDNTKLTVTGISGVNPALSLTSPVTNVTGNTFYFGWNADPSLTNGVTISSPGSQLLFNIHFTTVTGTYPLVWDNNPTILCEYQNALIQGPYIDEPTIDFYKDGFISDLNGSVSATTDVICKGANDGTITLAASGGSYPNVIFMISDGTPVTNTTGAFTGLAPGTYDAWVIDAVYPWVIWKIASGIIISEPATALTGDGFESHRVRCKGESNGQAIMNASGGWGGILYSIDGINYVPTNHFDALSAGTYTLYAKDAKGCVITDIVLISEPIIALTASGVESKVVTCKGGNDGEITLTGFGGWGSYWYSKDNITYYLTPTLAGFSAGTHTVYVKDDGHCVYPVNVTVTEPVDYLTVTSTVSKNVTCWGYSDGEITVNPAGGWGSYEYSKDLIAWQSSNILTGFSAGTHDVYVKDLHGCIVASTSVLVTQPGHLYGVISGTTTICYNDEAEVTIDMWGGTPPYTVVYKKTGGSDITVTTSSSQHKFKQPYTVGTTWTLVSLTDANGCTSTISGEAIITVNPLPVVTLVDLRTDTDENFTNPQNVSGNLAGGYVLCVDPLIPFHYLDITNLANTPVPLAINNLNPFYLKTATLPAGFYSYWAAKGVDGVNNAGGWELAMWQIINGTQPMLYLQYDGTDYTLIDGLQFLVGSVQNPLRITGNYPQGLYSFEGTVLDQNGCTSDKFSINMQLNSSPVVHDITMIQSTDLSNWLPVAGSFATEFEMCIDELVQYHYLDVATVSSTLNPLAVTTPATVDQNAFYLDISSVPSGFYTYWNNKGVNISAVGGWEEIMWDIINGTAPMFYLTYNGTDYDLIDGLQYQASGGLLVNPLRISNDYPAGTYTFFGTVTDINGCVSSPFEVDLKMITMPQPNAGTDDISCNNAEYKLNATPSVGTGVWSFTGPGIAVIADVNDVSSTVEVDVAGAYTFTFTETNGICERSDDVVITFLKGTNADAYNIAPKANVNAVSGAPVVARFSYNLPTPDVNADAGIIMDGLLSLTTGTFPVGMEIIEARRVAPITTTWFKVVNGDLNGKNHIFLSDIIGVANPLKNNKLNDYNWVITTKDANGTTGTLDMNFALVTYLTKPTNLASDCYSVLDQINWSVTYDEALVSAADAETCSGDPLPFSVSIAYPTISNVDDNLEILLDAKITITNGGPFNSGATLLWGYNAPATNPSATNIDGKTSIYLSDIVGLPPFPLTGHSGTDVWNLTINGLNVGIYDLLIQSVAKITVVEPPLTPLQIPGLPANPSNTYPAPAPADYVTYEYFYADDQMKLTVHPLPTITLNNANPKVCVGDTQVEFPYSATTNNPDLYSIIWDATALSNGFVNVSNASLPAGVITVTIPGSAPQGVYNGLLYVINSVTGCVSLVYPITVNIPAPFAVNPTQVPVTCNGLNDGQASANVTGSWGGYSYLWDDPAGQTTDPAVKLYAGSYNVLITDVEGCTTTTSVTVTEPDVLSAYVSKTDITCFGLTDGTITVFDPQGGYGTWEVSINSTNWFTVTTSVPYTFTGLAANTYSVWIRDAAHTSCTVYLGDQTIVEPAPIVVSGFFNYHNLANTPLNNVTVELHQSSVMIYSNITLPNGYYSFPNVCPGTYEVVATTGKSTIGSINSSDAVQVNIWGLAPNTIEKVRFIAGDVMNNNVLNAADAGRILQYFVQNGNPLFAVNAWSFWKTNDPISVNNFTDGTYPSITVLSSNVTQDFFGLVTGDFNRSFTPGTAKSGSSVTLSNQNSVQVGDDGFIQLPVSTLNDADVTAISLILSYPADKVEVVDVTLGENNTVPVMFNAQNGVLRIGYASVMPFMINSGDALLTLKLKALPGLTTGETVTFTLVQDILNELAGADYNPMAMSYLNIAVVEGTVNVPVVKKSDKLDLSNYPNPFNGHTLFTYNLPVDGEVQLSIYDITGRKVNALVNEFQAAGEYTVNMTDILPGAGVYMANLTLNSPQGTISRTIRIVNRK